jgi:hypothetical protein
MFVERIIPVPAVLTGEQRDHLAGIADRTPANIALVRATPIVTSFTPQNV